MQIYQVKTKKFTGTQYAEIYKKAFVIYKKIKSKTKRRPYIRSAYFDKEKIFLELFWQHLHEKLNFRDKARRVKYFACAIELIQNSKYEPSTKINPNKKSETLYRFSGVLNTGEIFYVQIKEEKDGQKWLVSVFPKDN